MKKERLEYLAEHSRKNYKHLHIKIPKRETELIEWISTKPNINGYIIELIRRDYYETIRRPDATISI